MNQETKRAYAASRRLEGKPFHSACYLPYVSLYFNTNGDVVACCKNTTYVLGNVARESLDDIWRGKRIVAMRKALANYQFGVGCEFCEWQIRSGEYEQVYAAGFDFLSVESEQPEWPGMMEFALSNTCNLACVMCYGVLSSTIRAQREKLPPMPRVYDDRFFADLRKYLPHLQLAKFFGGEPFLAQESYSVWNMMIEDGIEIPIHVTTNGTQYDKKVERILEQFPVHLNISIDAATAETYQSIRVHASFEAVMENLQRFRDYAARRGTHIALSFCLMRQNWHEFATFLQRAEDMGLPVFVNTVIDPDHSSLYTLGPGELTEITRQMEAMGGPVCRDLQRNGAVWRSVLESLERSANEDQVQGVGAIKAAAARRKRTRQEPLAKVRRLSEQEKLGEALELLDAMSEREAKTYEAWLARGHVLRRLHRMDEAEAALESALAAWSRDPRVFVERAWLRLAQGETVAGLEDARAALDKIDGDTSHEFAPAIFDALAFIYDGMGKHAEAIEAADRVIELRPDGVHGHVHRGWLLVWAGRFEEALESARVATSVRAAGKCEQVGDSPEVPILEAHCLRQLGRSAACEDALAAILERWPGSAHAQVERAWLRLAERRLEEGLEDARMAWQEIGGDLGHPLAPAVLDVEGLLQSNLGRHEDARRAVDRLVELQPRNPSSRIHRGWVLLGGGCPAEALEEARLALQLAPRTAEAEDLEARATASLDVAERGGL